MAVADWDYAIVTLGSSSSSDLVCHLLSAISVLSKHTVVSLEVWVIVTAARRRYDALC